jgi:hypothetical protein
VWLVGRACVLVYVVQKAEPLDGGGVSVLTKDDSASQLSQTTRKGRGKAKVMGRATVSLDETAALKGPGHTQRFSEAGAAKGYFVQKCSVQPPLTDSAVLNSGACVVVLVARARPPASPDDCAVPGRTDDWGVLNAA